MSPWPSPSTSPPQRSLPPPPHPTLPSPTPGIPPSLLRLHLASQRLRPKTLRSLSQGAQIRTLAPDLSLFITTSATEGRVSLNGVRINESALFDDGSLMIIYAAEDFFDPSFRISSLPAQSLAHPGSVIQCQPSNPSRSLASASAKLRSIGYSSIAAFLDLQLEWAAPRGQQCSRRGTTFWVAVRGLSASPWRCSGGMWCRAGSQAAT